MSFKWPVPAVCADISLSLSDPTTHSTAPLCVCVGEVCVVCVCVAGDCVVLAEAVVNLFSRSAAYIPPPITTL